MKYWMPSLPQSLLVRLAFRNPGSRDQEESKEVLALVKENLSRNIRQIRHAYVYHYSIMLTKNNKMLIQKDVSFHSIEYKWSNILCFYWSCCKCYTKVEVGPLNLVFKGCGLSYRILYMIKKYFRFLLQLAVFGIQR